MYVCARGVKIVLYHAKNVSSHVCVCATGVMIVLYHARKVSSHVCVC